MVDRKSGFGQPALPTTPSPLRTGAREALANRESFLDGKIMTAAKVLAHLNRQASRYTLSPRVVTLPTHPLTFSLQKPYIPQWQVQEYNVKQFPVEQSMKPMVNTIKTLINTSRAKNDASAAWARKTPGVIHAQVVNGAVVVVYDSSVKPVTNVLGIYSPADDHLGEYYQASNNHTGLIFVDVNDKKYKNSNQTPALVLYHELGHHNAALVRYALSREQDVSMHSIIPANSALFRRFRRGLEANDEQAIRSDKRFYEALLRRPMTEAEVDNVNQQRHYLNEVHSSFLGNQSQYFNLDNKEAYNNIRKGVHYELVGLATADQHNALYLLGLIQAVMALERSVFGMNKSELPKGIIQATNDWENMYSLFAGVLGSALTIVQAIRLAENVFDNFRRLHNDLFKPNSWEHKKLQTYFEENKKYGFTPDAKSILDIR